MQNYTMFHFVVTEKKTFSYNNIIFIKRDFVKKVYSLVLVLFLAGCHSQEAKPHHSKEIKETSTQEQTLILPPQELSYYIHDFQEKNISIDQSNYEKNYFQIWNVEKPPFDANTVMWAFHNFNPQNSYGENLLPRTDTFFDKMRSYANFEAYGSIDKKALSLHELNIRAMPTEKPIFLNPSRAGEGFPFDYLQNSTVHANKPLFVTHYSKDKKWAHIFTGFAYGWVKSKDIVIIEDRYAKLWQEAQQVFVTQDDVPLYDQDGNYLFDTKLGMMFALIGEDDKSFTVLGVAKYKNNQAYYRKVKISKAIAHKGILALNRENLTHVISNVIGKNYGWGGIFGLRDCSSTLRDIFAPFGIWLPRNSSQQSKVGEIISLDGLSDDEKIARIKQKAKPFATLLYKHGHIALYAGEYHHEPIVLQDVWGVKTKNKEGKEGRFIIGKTVFSTLDVGKELDEFDTNGSLLHNLKSMNTLF